MASIFDRIYAISPVWVQNLGINVYGLVWRHRRFGGKFKSYVQGFQARNHYTQEQWEDYQIQELRQLLLFATQHVPHYRRIFEKSDILPEDLEHADMDILTQLPLLEKEELRVDPQSFIVENILSRHLHPYNTSGTTGTPFAIYYTNDMHRKWSAAYEVRVRHWAGVNYKMGRVMIGGRIVVPDAESSPPFWRYNAFEQQLYMSAFHISPENVPYYVDTINQYKPDYLVGYASSHFFLARMIVELELKVHQPQAVLTSSEKLTNEMRETILQAYGCEVFDAYSGVEAACLVSECEYHRLHISSDVGIIELVDDVGNPVSPGELGEILVTGLLNYAQPLIRFRTGDLAALSDEQCPCGRQMPILRELVGRLEDTVIGPDGREIVRFHGIFIGLSNIREGQVIQDELTKFRLKLVVDPGFNEADQDIIYKRFEERVGSVDISYEYVDRIERTTRGKYRSVISHVKRRATNRNR